MLEFDIDIQHVMRGYQEVCYCYRIYTILRDSRIRCALLPSVLGIAPT
jgi:hypothetical protein